MKETLKFNKVVIVGVGLIGGSLAINLKDKNMAGVIVGVGRGKENLEKAVELNVIDSYTHDIKEAVKDADLVFLSVPVLSIVPLFNEIKDILKDGAIVTDGGSAKGKITEEIEKVIPDNIHFVGGHPIAGTEFSGVESAFKELYEHHFTILTPTDKTDKVAVKKVEEMWLACSSKVVVMDAKRHDLILAAISHLPHVIAYNLVNTIADLEKDNDDILCFSAGGFKDFTRIASSSPEMWSDICKMNKDSLLETIDLFTKSLTLLRDEIEREDKDAMIREFKRAKIVRDELIEKTKDL